MTLLEIAAIARELTELVQNDEIDQQTKEDTLESIGAEDKVETYGQIITDIKGEIAVIEAQIKALQEEEARLKEVIDRKESTINSMKYRLGVFLDANGGGKMKGITYTAFFRETRSTKITDEKKIPGEYMTVKTTTSPNRLAIKEALDRGEKIAGAEIEVTRSVQIR